MKIWIHIDGAQQGPFEADSLPLDKITDDTPVWHEGLDKWTRAGDVPAVACLLHPENSTSTASPETPNAAEHAVHAQHAETHRHSISDRPENQCPANYLVWSILLTLLCCNPIGIIPIITGAGVRTRWRNQHYDSAARQSEATAWWLMITIVTSLMLAPLTLLLQSL